MASRGRRTRVCNFLHLRRSSREPGPPAGASNPGSVGQTKAVRRRGSSRGLRRSQVLGNSWFVPGPPQAAAGTWWPRCAASEGGGFLLTPGTFRDAVRHRPRRQTTRVRVFSYISASAQRGGKTSVNTVLSSRRTRGGSLSALRGAVRPRVSVGSRGQRQGTASPTERACGRRLLPVIRPEAASWQLCSQPSTLPLTITSRPDSCPGLDRLLPSLDLLCSRLLPGRSWSIRPSGRLGASGRGTRGS